MCIKKSYSYVIKDRQYKKISGYYKKAKKVAITAVMRKMILTAMGVLRNQEPFDPNWAKKVQAKYQEKLKVA